MHGIITWLHLACMHTRTHVRHLNIPHTHIPTNPHVLQVYHIGVVTCWPGLWNFALVILPVVRVRNVVSLLAGGRCDEKLKDCIGCSHALCGFGAVLWFSVHGGISVHAILAGDILLSCMQECVSQPLTRHVTIHHCQPLALSAAVHAPSMYLRLAMRACMHAYKLVLQ